MAMYRVLKPFNTTLRRFRVVGDERDQLEIDGPLSIDQLVKTGYIKPAAAAEQPHQVSAPPKSQASAPPVVDTSDKDEVEKK